MKKISDLIESINLDIDILGITDDSRKVKEGYLFVATQGFNEDHYFYVDEAIEKGAVFIVSNRKLERDFPHFIVEKNINDFYIDCCRKFYDVDLAEFNFIGITGTDGKTTTASIIHELLDYAYIGTNGISVGEEEFSTNNTTPVVEELYRGLKLIKDKGYNNVVMEVSSEALLHKRLKDFKFETVGFTNITEDHLNVHGTIENYRKCKFELVNYLKDGKTCFINGDCDNCKLLGYKNKISYGMNKDNDAVIYDVKELANLVKFRVNYRKKDYEVESSLLGMYNVYNVTLAFLICLEMGIDEYELLKKIAKLKTVKGRREFLDFGQEFTVVLDYAHTFNGIKCLVESFQNYERIIVVTGSAGGREKEKRKLIGKYLLDNTDVTIFTMDDPREESVDDIIDDMLEDTDKRNYYRIVDRKKAIEKAFQMADKKTVVLVIGKGRDNYMAIGRRKNFYSDYEVIKKLLS